MASLGIVVEQATSTSSNKDQVALDHSLVTRIDVNDYFSGHRDGNKLLGFDGGELRPDSGPRLRLGDRVVSLGHARIRPTKPAGFSFDITDDVGHVWATLDHPHYDFSPDNTAVWLRDTDLRVGPALAEFGNHKEWTGLVIGSMDMTLPLNADKLAGASELPRLYSQCPVVWPSSKAKVDLTMIRLEHDPQLGGLADGIAFMRCGIPDKAGKYLSCTASSTNGLVVFAPDAALKSIGTAAIAWHPMFSKGLAPYDNDQHPYLFWNLYRINANGTIQQIGRSGAKHAYHADNFGCPCPQGDAAYPTCQETYASGTNDTLHALGPRREIIANTGIWGRCGSVFDPDCDGLPNVERSQHDDGFAERLAVLENDLLSGANPQANYYFEYGYLVRDDVDLENSFATRKVIPVKHVGERGAVRWSIDPVTFANGPAINAWVNPKQPTNRQLSTQVSTPFGHVRVASKVTGLGNGRYRYNYAVMNEDFARVETEGIEPNVRVKSERGIDTFTVPLGSDAEARDLTFLDADASEENDWHAETTKGGISWRSVADNSLTWGTLYSFSLVSDRAPERGKAMFAAASDGQLFSSMILLPRLAR